MTLASATSLATYQRRAIQNRATTPAGASTGVPELAKLSGIAQGDISKLENGHLDARWSTIKRLSDALAPVKEPKTSLAHGGYRRTEPDVSGLERWKPSGKAKHSITVVK